jgi:hypothetical protein
MADWFRSSGVIVCDTGPLVAAALANDSDHKACVALFDGLPAAGRQLLVPATVVAEVGYLLARESGARLEALFPQSLAEGDFTPVELTAADNARMADLDGRPSFRPGVSHGRFRNLKPNAANTRTIPTFTISRSQSWCLKNRTSTPTTTATSAST